MALSYEYGCPDLKKQPLKERLQSGQTESPHLMFPACALRIKASVMATHYYKSTIPKSTLTDGTPITHIPTAVLLLSPALQRQIQQSLTTVLDLADTEHILSYAQGSHEEDVQCQTRLGSLIKLMLRQIRFTQSIIQRDARDKGKEHWEDSRESLPGHNVQMQIH